VSLAVKAVLFDLFDTLVSFDRERLPRVVVNGREVRSTCEKLHEVLCTHATGLTLEACYDALTWSWREAERRRAVDYREVAAQERFGLVLSRLAIDPAGCPAGFVDTLLETHRRELSKAAAFPAHHAMVLERLAAKYRLAVVSNFDYTPTALGILDDAGVTGRFEIIVVSDAVGWRKPRREIFEVALAHVAVAPHEALFVGDRADIDVAGAHGLGMPVAWINPDREPLPAGITPPTYEIRDLRELLEILEA
jgi:FMN phosphatase YigB (HAD superfamily)